MLEPLMSGDAFHAALEAFRKADENSQDECRSVLIRAYAIAQTRAEIYSAAWPWSLPSTVETRP